MKHIDKDEMEKIEKTLGYDHCGLKMKDDWAVSYHRSKLHNHTVYYFKHSMIEYVFVPDELF